MLQSEEGYTLLELLVVLVILTIIIGVAAPAVLEQLGESKSKAAEVEVARLMTNLEFYFVDAGEFPADADFSSAITPYLSENADLIDPWGNEYQYSNSGTTVTISSMGPDGAVGGDDDVSVSRNADVN